MDDNFKTAVNKALVGAAAVTALAAGGLVASATPAHAATTLGGLNLDAYCRAISIGSSWVWIQSPQNVYQWRCSNRYFNAGTWWTYTKGMDMNSACRWTYGSGAYAGYLNYNNPYTWRCYR